MFSALSRAKECNPNIRLCEAGLSASSDGPKATLKAAWEADPLRKALVVNRNRVRKA